MYNIKLNPYIPEPNPPKADRIVAAHYYPAWKKGAAGVHNGFDDLADIYPDRTPLMGYYDEENPEVCDWEIKWTTEHGINCFIYCWYRKADNMGKPVTTNDLRCGHGIHEAFFNAKFREWSNIWYLSPEKYRNVLREMKEISDSLPENAWARKIIMIDNRNEWDEGHFVAPSHKFGYKYLQAIREELSDCSNLPDYISPKDQGFGDYNKSWRTPDFAEFCNNKLKSTP